MLHVRLFALLTVASNDFDNLMKRARTEYRTGHFADAEKSFTAAIGALAPDDQTNRAAALSELGYVLASEDELPQAEQVYREALSLFRKLRDADQTALTLRSLAVIYSFHRRDDEALRALQEALKLVNGLNRDPVVRVQVLNSLGVVYYRQGRNNKAEKAFQEALMLASAPGRPFDMAEVLNNLGAVYHSKRDFAKAEEFFKQSLQATEKIVGPSHPDVAFTLTALGVLYKDTARYVEAEEQFQRALIILESSHPQLETRVARTLHALAMTYARAGRKGDGIATLARAAKTARPLIEAHPDLAPILEDYSALLKNEGRKQEAEQLRSEAQRARVAAGLVISANSLR